MTDKFKTHKGTELPLINLKGKLYLQVAHRIVWFREEKPNFSIKTCAHSIQEDHAIFFAEIIDESGRVLSMAHKREDKASFPDFIEKAETGAIGRALAFLGYGTQFATQEIDEGGRFADAPTQPAKKPASTAQTNPAVVTPIKKNTDGFFPNEPKY